MRKENSGMNGYGDKFLRVDLSNGKVSKEAIPDSMKRDFLGGRGFAVKLLWDEVKQADPLSEKNKIIFSTGPLSGQMLPSAGKMVIASKSPLTGGYGDGNIGTMASVHLKPPSSMSTSWSIISSDNSFM